MKRLLFAAMAALAFAPPVLAIDMIPLGKDMVIQVNPNVIKKLGVMPMTVKGKGCTFYENANGGGESWHKAVGWLYSEPNQSNSKYVYAESMPTLGDWWNDRISSLKCDMNENVRCSVALYKDANMGGQDAAFDAAGGLINLDQYGFNDQVSSAMIFCTKMK